MKDDEASNKYPFLIDQKCPICFRKDECMLLPSQWANLCLGPFKNEEDRAEKIRIDNLREEEAIEKEREAGLKKLRKIDMREQRIFNRWLAEISFEKGSLKKHED